jgi:hypothetical protein
MKTSPRADMVVCGFIHASVSRSKQKLKIGAPPIIATKRIILPLDRPESTHYIGTIRLGELPHVAQYGA